MIRRGDQEGLLRRGSPNWKRHRKDAALAITSQTGEFPLKAHALLEKIAQRLDEHG